MRLSGEWTEGMPKVVGGWESMTVVRNACDIGVTVPRLNTENSIIPLSVSIGGDAGLHL